MTADSDPVRAQSGQRGAYTLGGAGALVLAAVYFGWVLHSAVDVGVGDYLLAVLNLGDTSTPYSGLRFADTESLARAVAFTVAGVLALMWRRVAKGALLMISALAAYQALRQIAGLTDGSYRDFLLKDTRGIMMLLTSLVTVVVVLVIAGAMLLGTRTPVRPGGPGPLGGWQQPPPYQPPYAPQPHQPGQGYGFPQPPDPPQPPGAF